MTYQEMINSNFMYMLGAIVAAFVLIQSTVFLVRAYKRGIAIGISKEKLFKAIRTSAIFTVLPSLSIVIALFTMVKALGVPIPWIRLSVVGAVTYELPVAEQAAQAMGMTKGLADTNFNMDVLAGVVLIMSIGIIWGILFSAFNGVKLVNARINKVQTKDKKWGEIFVSCMLMGLIAAFLGSTVSPPIMQMIKKELPVYDGLTTILVLVTSAIFMFILTTIAKKSDKLKWLDGFALTLSMVISMALALLYHALLGGTN